MNQFVQRMVWEKMRQGDENAFFDLYAAFYRDLTNFALRTCADADVSSEAVNQVFLSIWEKRRTIARVENVQAYLITILKRKVFRLLEKQRKISSALQNFGVEDDWFEMPYDEFIIKVQTNEITQYRLKTALGKLTFRQKQVIQLKFFEGFTYEKISEKTNMSVKTAYNTLYDALKILREELKDF